MDACDPMQGSLFKYGRRQTNVAFISGNSEKHVILVGGLGDGMLFAPYCLPLAEYLHKSGWSLVQTLMSSSHCGWGIGSLDQDAEEIHLLATYLRQRLNSKGFVLMGHSTGCQDTVRYGKSFLSSTDTPPVLGFILQAPISDREAQGMKPGTVVQERLDAAQLMVANGKGEEILYRDWDMGGTPICARRAVALLAVEGDDDFFSSDFDDDQLKDKLGHMGSVPVLLLFGGADEGVPQKVDKGLLVRRMAAAIGSSATPVLVEGGKHNLTGHEKQLVQHVAKFLTGLS